MLIFTEWFGKKKLVIFLCCVHSWKKGRNKCYEYWPNENTEKIMDVSNDFTVTFEGIQNHTSDIINKCCKIRILKIKNLLKNEEREIIHYNMLSWPDFGTPVEEEYEVIEDILKIISKKENDEKSKNKIIVHCSAGIGRTGTLIAIYN